MLFLLNELLTSLRVWNAMRQKNKQGQVSPTMFFVRWQWSNCCSFPFASVASLSRLEKETYLLMRDLWEIRRWTSIQMVFGCYFAQWQHSKDDFSSLVGRRLSLQQNIKSQLFCGVYIFIYPRKYSPLKRQSGVKFPSAEMKPTFHSCFNEVVCSCTKRLTLYQNLGTIFFLYL